LLAVPVESKCKYIPLITKLGLDDCKAFKAEIPFLYVKILNSEEIPSAFTQYPINLLLTGS